MIDLITKNFVDRNIEFEYYETRQALIKDIKEEFSKVSTIGIGNSQTLKALNISQMALEANKKVFDKTLADTNDDIRRLKKLALTSDCFVTSSNAITRDGKLVNVDHSGNRVAAMTYGPDRVLIVVGENKLVANENEAMTRALKLATPKNAKRAGIKSPCSLNKACPTCQQEVRVCNYISIIRGQHIKGRMKVFMLKESLGY